MGASRVSAAGPESSGSVPCSTSSACAWFRVSASPGEPGPASTSAAVKGNTSALQVPSIPCMKSVKCLAPVPVDAEQLCAQQLGPAHVCWCSLGPLQHSRFHQRKHTGMIVKPTSIDAPAPVRRRAAVKCVSRVAEQGGGVQWWRRLAGLQQQREGPRVVHTALLLQECLCNVTAAHGCM